MKKALIVILIVVVLILGGSLIALKVLSGDVTTTSDVRITIEDGSSTSTIAQVLQDNGLVKNGRIFRYYAKQNGVDSQFKAGEYTFAAGTWSMEAVSDKLIEGGVSMGDYLVLTITEGQRIKDIVATLVGLGVTSEEAFYDYAQNGNFSYSYLPAAGTENRLEGFLPPDTYYLDLQWTEVEVIDMLLAHFDSLWTAERQARAEELDMTVREVLTMASIVEREAVLDSDRALIAGVFYNRLEAGMMLQSNVTVEYAMGEWKLDLTYEDIAIDSPYNTYIHTGLPPGPVCSPGQASIDAALYPEDSEYLYFWGQKDGSTRFSKTLEEHQAGGENDL